MCRHTKINRNERKYLKFLKSGDIITVGNSQYRLDSINKRRYTMTMLTDVSDYGNY